MEFIENKFLCAVLCYNNEKTIETLITDLNKILENKDIKIVYIEDKSSDNTLGILKQNNCETLSHQKNLGYGAAVKTALKYAVKNNFDFLCIFPGDYQRAVNDLMLMINIVKKENDYDVVSGSKFSQAEHLPIYRKLGNVFFSKLAKYMWGSQLEDVLSGFKLYNVKKFAKLIDYPPNNYSFDLVLNQIFSYKKFKCKEFNAEVKYNEQTSKMKSIFHLGKKNILYVGVNMFVYSIFTFINIKILKKLK